MISEKDVLKALDDFGEKIKSLRKETIDKSNEIISKDKIISDLNDKVLNLTQENVNLKNEMKLLKNNIDNLNSQIDSLKQNSSKELNDSTKAVNEIALNLRTMLDSKMNSLEAENESLRKQIAEKDSKIAQLMTPREINDMTVDDMMHKIKTSEVKTSEVDKKLDEIKVERFTQPYEWGRANKATVDLFVSTVEALWKDAPKINNLYILNSRAADMVMSRTNDSDTKQTFINFLLRTGLMKKNELGEFTSNAELSSVIKRITEVKDS